MVLGAISSLRAKISHFEIWGPHGVQNGPFNGVAYSEFLRTFLGLLRLINYHPMYLPPSAIVIRGPFLLKSQNAQIEPNGQPKWQFLANILGTKRDTTIKICSTPLNVAILLRLRWFL